MNEVTTTTSRLESASTDIQFMYNEIRKIERERDNYKEKYEERESKVNKLNKKIWEIYDSFVEFGNFYMVPVEDVSKMKKNEIIKFYEHMFKSYNERIYSAGKGRYGEED